MVLVHPVITSEKYQFGAKAAANFTFPLTHIHAATSGYLSGIKQWGNNSDGENTTTTVNLNIVMTVLSAIPFDISTKANSACYLCWISSTTTSITFGANTAPYGYGWVAIGKQ